MKQQIILADKSYIIRRGLTDMIESIAQKNNTPLVVMAEASSVTELYHLLAHHRPDYLFLSLQLTASEQYPHQSEIEDLLLVKDIKQRHPEIEIITTSPFQNLRLLQSAIKAGAHSFISHNVSENFLSMLFSQPHKNLNSNTDSSLIAFQQGRTGKEQSPTTCQAEIISLAEYSLSRSK
ncbi:hypothetical protein AB1287_17415 [Enterobacter asburiae]|uniref:hypothetical protein n=1 Tax=Scandinavium sp. UTDF21-P1B TaxID=3446379 RepID=UPI00348BE8F2